jgi:5S rRNA maturation endonuclease (ribonuclease M5)
VVIAFDNDEPGREMAERIKAQLPNATRKIPSSIDWNQDLVRTFDWANQKRSHEINRQHQRGIERGGGLSL